MITIPMVTPAPAFAAPNIISFQGKLADIAGAPVADGDYPMVFRIYDAVSLGSRLWEESHLVPVARGVYHVLLGSGTPSSGQLGPLLFSQDARWLEVLVNGEILGPRQRIVSVAYALRAEEAAGVANNSITTATLQNGAVDGTKLADNAVTATKIQDGSVGASKLANNAVTGATIENGSISSLDISDGPGSGLDADTLDGTQGASFLRSDTSDTFTAGTLTLGPGTTLDASGAALKVGSTVNIVGGSMFTVDTTGGTADVTIGGANVIINLGDSAADLVNVPGRIVTGSLAYGVPRTGYLMLPGSAFDVGSNTTDPWNKVADYGWLAGTGTVNLTAPVMLPHQATVTEFRCYYYENISVGSLTLTPNLYRRPLNSYTLTEAMTNIATVGPTVTGGAIRSVADTTITNPNIDNQNYAYHASISFNPTFSHSNIRFYGCRIEYALTEILP